MTVKQILITFLVCLSIFSCKKKQSSPFDYELIKSKLNLTKAEIEAFDKIIDEYTEKLIHNYRFSNKSKAEKLKAGKQISATQDSLVQELLTKEKFKIYQTEIAIERSGRDKHNVNLIKKQLNLDSLQTQKFDMANNAFYTTLDDNHDYYHGKPDVYLQYYKEVDVNRQKVFEQILTQEQLALYNKLKVEYNIGKSEH